MGIGAADKDVDDAAAEDDAEALRGDVGKKWENEKREEDEERRSREMGEVEE